ncbi:MULTISPECIES: homocysteine S-methyltransferase [Brevibacterium]|uniref:Homocysteine S-methyltransferase n=1 Tax=Brevibacterium casei TaxID=33889 RepID=A0A7T9YQV8_9MICO|nr:homocysteine S-methyltransferase [Brevibacterium casei]NJE66626.1 homocysteine S-methyltransferase [Brevibacterium sp. LS14]SIH10546.1 homocysteine methyltransferase [Mycobacteroides abscessus subsp. abscessus]MBE4694073.1 homocysteine S-methyltransferase [Brevibacterium casei]MBY3577196.1 homocysteine S-methyltransferase [Brevibacterium casei]MCT1765165.1 homocysteine S-methyltransferase [Brevibacterium casei]
MRPRLTAVLETAVRSRRPLVTDGGLGTALESRGIVLDHDLWSAGLLRDDPDTLAEVHAAFARAGADIVTTASYQIGPRAGLTDTGLTDTAVRRLCADSVTLAREAASRGTAAPVLIAGSVGPFGAVLGDGSEYTGDYALTDAEFAAFHRPRIEALAEAGADVIALETQPNLPEIRVLADLVEETRVPAWLSVTLADGGPTGVPRLPDGTPLTALAAVAAAHPTVRAVGVNCVRPDQVSPALEALAAVTELPLIAYPNSGETYDAESMTWQDPTAEAGERLGAWPVADWIARGARIVGGCCRTTPADIAELVLRASSRG